MNNNYVNKWIRLITESEETYTNLATVIDYINSSEYDRDMDNIVSTLEKFSYDDIMPKNMRLSLSELKNVLHEYVLIEHDFDLIEDASESSFTIYDVDVYDWLDFDAHIKGKYVPATLYDPPEEPELVIDNIELTDHARNNIETYYKHCLLVKKSDLISSNLSAVETDGDDFKLPKTASENIQDFNLFGTCSQFTEKALEFQFLVCCNEDMFNILKTLSSDNEMLKKKVLNTILERLTGYLIGDIYEDLFDKVERKIEQDKYDSWY